MTTVLERLNFGLMQAMEKDEKVYILGEDILDPYGGAFKVTRGLSTRFPERVLTTPISEAGIVGVSTGMAIRGIKPVVEIMFGDFTTLAFDQVVNHAAKFHWVYGEEVRVPLVIRTPMGGHRGYGPTHSQSLEKYFLGIPGLMVLAPNVLDDPADLLEEAIFGNGPVLFVEHKLLYPSRLLEAGKGELMDYHLEKSGEKAPTLILSPANKPNLTIATYGYNFEPVRKAALELMMEREIFSEIVVFSQLSPFRLQPLLASIGRTHRLLTVEEGGLTMGWGAEISARCHENAGDLKVRRVAARDLPIANSRPLEEAILPSVEEIICAAADLVAG